MGLQGWRICWNADVLELASRLRLKCRIGAWVEVVGGGGGVTDRGVKGEAVVVVREGRRVAESSSGGETTLPRSHVDDY